MSMGSLLRQYIHDHCGTISAFADDLGYPRKTVSNWCCDRVPVPIPKLAIIAEYFAEVAGIPPNLFILKLVMAHTDVGKVVTRWQQLMLKDDSTEKH